MALAQMIRQRDEGNIVAAEFHALRGPNER